MNDFDDEENTGEISIGISPVQWRKLYAAPPISKEKTMRHNPILASGVCIYCGQNVRNHLKDEECPGVPGNLPIFKDVEGVKFDADKLPYHLIAPELLSSIAEILAYGAKKYSPRNWEKGMAWHRPFRACIGHMWDWWRGAGPDPETGKSHLWHAACCIMFLIAYEARGIGEDDRPKD